MLNDIYNCDKYYAFDIFFLCMPSFNFILIWMGTVSCNLFSIQLSNNLTIKSLPSYIYWFETGAFIGHDRMVVVQSMPIITKRVRSNPVHGEVYAIQHYVIKFVSDLHSFLGVPRFPPPIKLTATILLKYWLSAKPHNPNCNTKCTSFETAFCLKL